MNLCVACGEDFGSVAAFDRHRTGDFPQTGPSEYADRLRAGLVPYDEPWQRSFGRRCLEPEEMLHHGFVRMANGRWSIASDVQRARKMHQTHRTEANT
jgi:hypothetical protein